jgi:hypothetical protein
MRETIKKTLMTTILFLILCLSTFGANADPTVETVVTNPSEPEQLSTFTVIATITGENITSVKVAFSECCGDTCFVSQSNIPMSLNDDGKYEAEVTLTGTQESISEIHYTFTIDDNGTEYESGILKTYLKTDNGGTNNDGADNQTPGFELVILLMAVFISLIYVKRKR